MEPVNTDKVDVRLQAVSCKGAAPGSPSSGMS